MPNIINPINKKPVEIRVVELGDGIAGRTKQSTLDKMVVYMDPLVPEAMYRSIVVHEYVELKRLLDGDTYKTAHEDATRAEKTCATKNGADWDAYNRNYLRLLRRVERRGATNPPDIFEGEEGERPTEKGADIGDIVVPGGQASRRHDIKEITECHTSDGKRTNCGNMPQVDKAVSPPDKNGRCHDENGYLASCGGGGSEGKKPSTRSPAGGVQSLDDALAGKPIEELPEEDAQEQTDFMAPNPKAVKYSGRTVKFVDDRAKVPEATKQAINKQVDDIVTNAKLHNLQEIQYKPLGQNVLMQCEGAWDDSTGKLVGKEVLAIDPQHMEYAQQKYFEDHARVGQKIMPWLANGHAPTPETAYKAVIVHEVAHAKMMEKVLSLPQSEWHDPNNPMQGTKEWMNIINEAHKAGWQGPSQYGRKNPGECFAECLSLLTILQSTGNKKVDDYVLGVLQG